MGLSDLFERLLGGWEVAVFVRRGGCDSRCTDLLDTPPDPCSPKVTSSLAQNILLVWIQATAGVTLGLHRAGEFGSHFFGDEQPFPGKHILSIRVPQNHLEETLSMVDEFRPIIPSLYLGTSGDDEYLAPHLFVVGRSCAVWLEVHHIQR